MIKRLKRKKARLHSKKGMSLVEILVAVTIIVIVFGGTIGAMANGYSTTMYNAKDNSSAVKCSSINDIIISGIKNLKLANNEEFEEYFFGEGRNPNTDEDNSVRAALMEFDTEVQYVEPDQFTNSDVSLRYTLVPNVSLPVDPGDTGEIIYVQGVRIKTAVESIGGTVFNYSFVPYGLS